MAAPILSRRGRRICIQSVVVCVLRSICIIIKRRKCVAFVSGGRGQMCDGIFVYLSMIFVISRRRRLRWSSSSSSELGRCSGDRRRGDWRLGSLDGATC